MKGQPLAHDALIEPFNNGNPSDYECAVLLLGRFISGSV